MARLGIVEGPQFDDIVPGKGRGLSVMLQYERLMSDWKVVPH